MNSDSKKTESHHGQERPRRQDGRTGHGHRSPHGPRDTERKSLMRQVADIDDKMLSLIFERSKLMARAQSARRSKGLPAASPEQEKQLWTAWDRAAMRLGLDPKPLRRLFGQLNSLGYDFGEPQQTGKEAKAYWFRPRRGPVRVSIPGPANLEATAMWTALAAVANQPLEMGPVVLNDPLVDLARALNQGGAHVSWKDETVTSTPGKGLEFEAKLMYAGDDPLALYLLLAIGIHQPGRMKFAGGSELKFLDLDFLRHFLPVLGARFHPLDPTSPGLPARLEAGGRMASSLEIPAECPAGLAMALALTGFLNPEGLELKFPGRPDVAAKTALAASILNLCGIDAESGKDFFKTPHGEPRLPEAPSLDMDPVLAAHVLALPLFADGEVRLEGRWPGQNATAREVEAAFASAGLVVETGEDFISACRGERRPESADLSMGKIPELAPLATAMGAGLEVPVTVSLAGESSFSARQFLDRFSVAHEETETDSGLSVALTPGNLEFTRPWASPSPHWSLALALMSYFGGGSALTNPGGLTSLWPRFTALFNALPVVTGQIPNRDKKNDDDKKSRRRIKIG